MIVSNLRLASTYWQKFRGLMLDDSLQPNEALLLDECQAIHCCFMRLKIDVLFLTAEGEVVHLVEQMAPWTFSKFVRKATQVLECYPGTIAKFGITVGERLTVLSYPIPHDASGMAANPTRIL